MYEAFFGLKSSPFSMTPDPGALFWTTAHREALAGLSYAVARRKGFVVLTGPAGTGKTTLLRKLLDTSPVPMRTSFVYNPTLTPAEFLELALADFDMPPGAMNKAQRLLRLEQFLLATHKAGQVAVLIIDEAHKLSPELLEEIRLLTNFETAKQKLLQIVLAGQPELTGLLNREDLWQLKQRIAVRLQIRPLVEAEIHQYLSLRWAKAGGADSHPFNEPAIELISKWSQGIPRMINGICDNALLAVFGGGRKVVGPEDILEVIRDLDLRSGTVTRKNGASAPSVAVHPAITPVAKNGTNSHSVAPHSNGAGQNGSGHSLRTLERYEEEQSESLLGRWAGKFGFRVRRPGIAK